MGACEPLVGSSNAEPHDKAMLSSVNKYRCLALPKRVAMLPAAMRAWNFSACAGAAPRGNLARRRPTTPAHGRAELDEFPFAMLQRVRELLAVDEADSPLAAAEDGSAIEKGTNAA